MHSVCANILRIGIRSYHLDKPRAEQPDFLTSPDRVEYIYGEWPLLLQFKWNGSDRKLEQHHPNAFFWQPRA